MRSSNKSPPVNLRHCREPASSWRKVYKALNVIDYCVKNGARRSDLEAAARDTDQAVESRCIVESLNGVYIDAIRCNYLQSRATKK